MPEGRRCPCRHAVTMHIHALITRSCNCYLFKFSKLGVHCGPRFREKIHWTPQFLVFGEKVFCHLCYCHCRALSPAAIPRLSIRRRRCIPRTRAVFMTGKHTLDCSYHTVKYYCIALILTTAHSQDPHAFWARKRQCHFPVFQIM